jgi:hypothetical protein
MKDKGWGSKTSSDKSYRNLLKNSVMNVIDLKKSGGHISSRWTKNKSK